MAPLGRPRWLKLSLELLLLVSVGCGTQGNTSVLPNLWPSAGLSGYAIYNEDSPLLLSEPGANLDQPTALPQGDGTTGGVVVWGRLSTTQGMMQSQLFSAQVPTLDNPSDPQPTLAATQPWEGADLGSPSIVATDPPLLFYQSTDGSVGLARLMGQNDTATKLTLAAPLVPAAFLGGSRHVGRIGAAFDPDTDGGSIRLYYTVDDVEVYVATAAAAPLIGGTDGSLPPNGGFGVRKAGLVAADFEVPPGDVSAVPADYIMELSVRRVVTPVGRVRWDLYVEASAGTQAALVAAAAYAESDGNDHFVAVTAPLLSSTDGDLLSPAVTLLSGQPLLLIGLRQVHTAIAAAVLP